MRKRNKTDMQRRNEITEKIDHDRDEMAEKTERLDTVASDNEIVTETLDGLDLDGTAEAAERIEAAIEQAQDVTHEVFEQEDDDLTEMLTETREYEGELHERSDASESDLGKVSDTADQVATEETKRELEQAKAEIDDDLLFLQERREAAREAREENERLQQESRSRLQSGRR